MKLIIGVILLCISLSHLTMAQAEALPVLQDLTLEAKESSSNQAPILVLFMSSTCTYCERVLREFLVPMQHNPEYASKVILRQVDIGNRHKLINFDGKITNSYTLAKSHQVVAVPTVILFDAKGTELTRIVGLLNADFYQAYLDNAITESQAIMK